MHLREMLNLVLGEIKKLTDVSFQKQDGAGNTVANRNTD